MEYDMYGAFGTMFSPVFSFIFSVLRNVFLFSLLVIVSFFVVFCVKYHCLPFSTTRRQLATLQIKWIPYNLLRWLWHDFIIRKQRSQDFKEYGFSIYCGRQGAGKTISMVEYLNDIHIRYPKCKIVTNFKYAHADKRMNDWRDLLEYRNGADGVVFAIDEIHSEYSAESWKDFPESLLSEISQQRKQRIKIVATSQVFSRVAKPIREQTFSVLICQTYFHRLTRVREYDAAEFSTMENPYQVRKKIKPINKRLFAQSNYVRGCYDTYEKIERMQKVKFIPRSERQQLNLF